jgi:hypothetical protein
LEYNYLPVFSLFFFEQTQLPGKIGSKSIASVVLYVPSCTLFKNIDVYYLLIEVFCAAKIKLPIGTAISLSWANLTTGPGANAFIR